MGKILMSLLDGYKNEKVSLKEVTNCVGSKLSYKLTELNAKYLSNN